MKIFTLRHFWPVILEAKRRESILLAMALVFAVFTACDSSSSSADPDPIAEVSSSGDDDENLSSSSRTKERLPVKVRFLVAISLAQVQKQKLLNQAAVLCLNPVARCRLLIKRFRVIRCNMEFGLLEVKNLFVKKAFLPLMYLHQVRLCRFLHLKNVSKKIVSLTKKKRMELS